MPEANEIFPELTPTERLRYSRHLVLPEVGLDGQKRLKAGSVLIIGAGGLGSPAGMYLAAAGVGRIGIVDFDKIDLSNLQRQIMHSTADVGTSKCASAEKRMHEINPEIAVVVHEEQVSQANIEALVKQYDVVIDATDNFSTRYLINDACVLANKPNIYGAIYRFEGQTSVFAPGRGPCYRCLFPSPPPPDAVPNCAEGGVLGVLAGVIGVLQATEAIRILLGLGSGLIGRLMLYDAMEMRFDTVNVKRDSDCPVCGDKPTITTVVDTAFSCAPAASGSSDSTGSSAEINAISLNRRLTAGDEFLLLDVRNPEEYILCSIPGCTLIPLPELATRMKDLDKGKEIIVYCKSGARSRKAMGMLEDAGYKNVKNLTGGILAWIAEVDPSMSSY
ncbi:MAG: molybdopterin-synthase adenylyltransferase MoeB [Cyanobacteria bacterium SZAS TMP-1]|nr:molybdopterin-synthase adenylyltransferase MoeB [Cyanobacteria bacterium SZAS TMP-1]